MYGSVATGMPAKKSLKTPGKREFPVSRTQSERFISGQWIQPQKIKKDILSAFSFRHSDLRLGLRLRANVPFHDESSSGGQNKGDCDNPRQASLVQVAKRMVPGAGRIDRALTQPS